ncbi:MAG TPA: helical backbone metal receptor [Drouetiella sp.]
MAGIAAKVGLKGIGILIATTFATSSHVGLCAENRTAAIKLASFAPSNTELLYAIGAQDKLAAVCSYCDYPEDAKQKKIVGNFISANLERLASVKPTKVVMVSGQEALAGQLEHNGYKVEILHNDHLSDISKNLRELSTLTGNTARGAAAASSLEKCLTDLKSIIDKTNSHPAVFYCIWPQPLLTIGQKSYLSETITACGGDSTSKNLEAAYPHFSLEKLVLANPDIIILPYECKDREFLKKHPWSSLKAVKSNRVFFLPDPSHDGLARPTLRVTNGLYWLAKIIHPELATQLDAWNSRTSASLSDYSGKLPSSPGASSKQAFAR